MYSHVQSFNGVQRGVFDSWLARANRNRPGFIEPVHSSVCVQWCIFYDSVVHFENCKSTAQRFLTYNKTAQQKQYNNVLSILSLVM